MSDRTKASSPPKLSLGSSPSSSSPSSSPSPPKSYSRRGFLRMGGLAAGATIASPLVAPLARAWAYQSGPSLDEPAAAWAEGRFGLGAARLPVSGPFTLGVASGEPTDRSVVLWTRLAPDPLAGGGMEPRKVTVNWEVATDPGMQNVIRFGSVRATPKHGHSVHARVGRLPSDSWLWYRFIAEGESSPVGRTRTFPRPDQAPSSMRFALASCQNYEAGFWSAYDHMATEDLDFVVHVGDYIYEGGIGGGGVRQHNSSEVTSLDDYRNRYALYKLDPALQAAHAAFPFINTWDDHEVDNNYAGTTPEDGQTSAEFKARRTAAYQAFYEHLPLSRRSKPRRDKLRLARSLDFGDLARLHMLDTRQFRSAPCDGPGGLACEDAFAPTSTMLGYNQERSLRASLGRSRALWNVMAQSVMMMQWNVLPGGQLPLVNFDQWDGYPVARQRLLDDLARGVGSNPVVITGDIHSSWAGDLKADYADPGSAIVGSEFVGTSISSVFPDQLETLAQNSLPGNPHIKYFNSSKRGYVRFDVDAVRWRADYRVVDDALNPASGISTDASFEIEAGVPGVLPASP